MKSIICFNVYSIISLLDCKIDYFIFIGCATSTLGMGIAPEAIVNFFWVLPQKYSLLVLSFVIMPCTNNF
jgi:hypothetical protein